MHEIGIDIIRTPPPTRVLRSVHKGRKGFMPSTPSTQLSRLVNHATGAKEDYAKLNHWTLDRYIPCKLNLLHISTHPTTHALRIRERFESHPTPRQYQTMYTLNTGPCWEVQGRFRREPLSIITGPRSRQLRWLHFCEDALFEVFGLPQTRGVLQTYRDAS